MLELFFPFLTRKLDLFLVIIKNRIFTGPQIRVRIGFFFLYSHPKHNYVVSTQKNRLNDVPAHNPREGVLQY